jgi:hypothetical protein
MTNPEFAGRVCEEKGISRRDLLAGSIAGAAFSTLGGMATAESAAADETAGEKAAADKASFRTRVEAYLKPLLYARADLDDWLSRKDYPFCKYDAELGYLHVDREFREGQDGALCTYRYDASDARRMLAYADQPCRINTYGDSFTSCRSPAAT